MWFYILAIIGILIYIFYRITQKHKDSSDRYSTPTLIRQPAKPYTPTAKTQSKQKQVPFIVQEKIDTRIKQLKESATLVNETVNPSVFFGRLNFILDLLLDLQKYEETYNFATKTPTEQYNDIIANLEKTVDNFIDRADAHNLEKIASLKTEKGKCANRARFVDTMIDSFDNAATFRSDDNIHPHYTGMLFTEKNYARVLELRDSKIADQSDAGDVPKTAPSGDTHGKTLSPLQLFDALPEKDRIQITQRYCAIQDCAQVLDDAKEPSAFEEQYNSLVKNLSEIAAFEPRVQFASGATLKERLDLARSMKADVAETIVARAFNTTCKKVAKLKTEKGKTNAIDRFFESLPQTKSIEEAAGKIRSHIEKNGITPYILKDNAQLSTLCNFALVYYTGGHISGVIPNANDDIYDQTNSTIYYNAIHIVVDGVEVDLTDADSIAHMPIASYTSRYSGSVTIDLAYQLKMVAIREKDPKIASVLIPKTAELMKRSSITWNEKDYRRLAEQLWYVDMVAEGDAFIKDYQCSFEEERAHRNADRLNRFHETLEQCHEFGTDLVEMSRDGSTCEECAKYEGRVFSISGKDKRFPKLPEEVFKYGGMHSGCRHSFSPYIYGSSLACSSADAVEYSNRPFADERTDAQKEDYQKYLNLLEKEERRWNLTSEYYHKRQVDAESVPGTVYKYLRLFD